MENQAISQDRARIQRGYGPWRRTGCARGEKHTRPRGGTIVSGEGAARVAAVRKLPLATVKDLIGKYTVGRSWGFFGEPGVNVLRLNIALDQEGK